MFCVTYEDVVAEREIDPLRRHSPLGISLSYGERRICPVVCWKCLLEFLGR